MEFQKKIFSDFYRREASSIDSPSAIGKREFGFTLFVEGRMYRHKRFDSVDKLRSFLSNTPISDAYYSCAYYEYPEAEMDKKGWMGADLIFDIDADHISTSCGKVHDQWICGDCGSAGKGLPPGKCPNCDSQRFTIKTWLCEDCLDSAKTETVKLLDMLQHDFGFSEDEIHVFFSGHRGYHVHVENEAIKTLDAVARKEIVDYLCGLGLDTGFQGLAKRESGKTHFSNSPRLSDFGWRGRLARKMCDFILKGEIEEYTNIGLGRDAFESIKQNRDIMLRNW